jgi:hypothetical protein
MEHSILYATMQAHSSGSNGGVNFRGRRRGSGGGLFLRLGRERCVLGNAKFLCHDGLNPPFQDFPLF